MEGEIAVPVSATRSGWAILPMPTSSSSAVMRTTWSSRSRLPDLQVRQAVADGPQRFFGDRAQVLFRCPGIEFLDILVKHAALIGHLPQGLDPVGLHTDQIGQRRTVAGSMPAFSKYQDRCPATSSAGRVFM